MGKISQLFLTLLGCAYFINFWVLHDQALLLFGEQGLLPIAPDLPLIQERLGLSAYWKFPTLFWFNASDTALQIGIWIGFIASLLLIFKVYPKVMLILLWGLFLSYVIAGRTFYSFQWDILMLEATLLALFLPSKKGVEPHWLSIFLFRLLAFKLHFESGIAKTWTGKQGGWLDLSAMEAYYNTAPIPTWLGWWAHQMPLKFHQFETIMTLVLEIAIPLLIFCGRRCRLIAFASLFPLQVLILLTANYGLFNYMTLATLLFLLCDKDLKWVGIRSDPAFVPINQRLSFLPKVIGLFIIFFSVLNFTYFLKPTLARPFDPFHLQQTLSPFRSINNYHLFASITPTRLVAEIQGTDDGLNWKTYSFKHYPSGRDHKPTFVAPYHPRLDFRLWFLTLSQRSEDWIYFTKLLEKIFHEPNTVSDYFKQIPFSEKPPTALRFIIYQYNMSTIKRRKETGSWWTRKEVNRSQIFYKETFKKTD